jgi:hypothetical protein
VTYLAPINCASSSTILPRTHFWPQIHLFEPQASPHRASSTTAAFRYRPAYSATIARPTPSSCLPFVPSDLHFLFPHGRQTPVDWSGPNGPCPTSPGRPMAAVHSGLVDQQCCRGPWDRALGSQVFNTKINCRSN